MTRRGPGPTPHSTAALKLAGTYRADRHGYLDAADVCADPPTRPDNLDDGAREEWDRVVPILARAGIVRDTDTSILSTYVRTVSRIARLHQELDGAPLLVAGSSGQDRPNPLFSILGGLETTMLRYASEIGCTPSSRARLARAVGQTTDSSTAPAFSEKPTLDMG